MLSKKIELPANEMAEAIELAKAENLEMLIYRLSSEEDCVARVLYPNSYKGHNALLRLIKHVHALELSRIRKSVPQLNLHLLTSKKQRV